MSLRFAVATTGRADWGLLSPIARVLADTPGVEVMIVAGNMHFNTALGFTAREIEADGFAIDAAVPAEGSPADIAAASLSGFAGAFARLRPDGVILLGDRYETLAVAMAAALAHIPVVHIAGGAISEGAFDDAFRHAITKLSALHLCETEEYRRRVIQLGENPETVFNTGAIGVWTMVHTPSMTLEELRADLGFDFDGETLLCTLHAATLSPLPPESQFAEMLAAFDRFPERKILITYPNNDVDPAPLIAMLGDYRSRYPGRICLVPSLGHRRYLAALRHCAAMVGNSSSGIVEAPSAGIPVLDIGIRQQGRACAPSVVHCAQTREEIAAGLREVLSPDFRMFARTAPNPYYNPDTLNIMKEAILSFPWKNPPLKKFYDIEV